MSEIVVICNEQAPDKFEKIDEIKNRALDTLEKYQKTNHLGIDGIVGKATYKALTE